MPNQSSELFIPDLAASDYAELKTLLAESFTQDELPEATLGARDVPTVTAVVVVSLAALRVLAVWISRHTQTEEKEVSVQTRRTDGSLKTITFRSKSSSAQSEAEVLKQLAAACRVDLNEATGSVSEEK